MPPRDYYNPVPTVAPQERPTPRIHEDFPHVQISDAVGRALQNVGTGYGVLGRAVGEVGQAMDSLGAQTKNAGNELWEKAVALKALESDKKVDDLVIAYNQKQTELGEDFRTKEGGNAGPDALTAHLKQGADLRAGMRNGLTPYEERKFDGESRGIYSQDASRSVTHSAQQVHQGLMKTSDAKISMLQDKVAKATTQKELDQAHKDLENELERQSNLKGWTPEQAEFNTRKEVSKATSMWIDNASDTQPQRAKEILEQAHKDGNITEEDYDKLKRSIEAKFTDYVARNAADRASQDPEATLEDKQQRGLVEARKITDDPKILDAVKRRINGDNAEYRREQLDLQRRNSDIMDSFLGGRTNPEGKIPTKKEEIDVDPIVKKAYESLPNHMKNGVLDRLGKNSLDDRRETPDEVEEYHRIKGLSYDPANYEMFKNLATRDLQLSKRHRDDIFNRKDEIEKQGIAAMSNPHVKRAEAVLRSQGLIPDAILKDTDQMNKLRSVMHDEIELLQKLQKGPMSEDQIRTMGLDLLSSTKGGFWGFLGGTVTKFEKMDETTKKRIDDYKKGFPGVEISDDEAMREIAKATYQEQFRKYHSKDKPAGQ